MAGFFRLQDDMTTGQRWYLSGPTGPAGEWLDDALVRGEEYLKGLPLEVAIWIRDWPGGRVRLARGREVFVIERSFAGRRYAVTLDVRTESDALAELALFERDPGGYRTRRQVAAADGTGPVFVDETTAAGFLAYLALHGRTERYRMDVRHSLAEWADVLAGRDLRQSRAGSCAGSSPGAGRQGASSGSRTSYVAINKSTGGRREHAPGWHVHEAGLGRAARLLVRIVAGTLTA